MAPVISVIVPVYKVEQYLDRCVSSILNQTFRDFEMILVDDGSPDRCGSMCDAYEEEDSRIHVIHRENGGLSAARNSGIEWVLANSESEYLTFIDSDDWVHPCFLRDMLDTAVTNNVLVCVAKYQYVSEYSNKFENYDDVPTAELMTAEELLVNHEWNYNYACMKLYHRECFANQRYPEGTVFEDVFTTYKILFACPQIALIDRELYFYYKNMSGITRAAWTSRELVILDAMRQQLGFYRANGYDKAYQKEEWLYINHHAYQLVRIRANRADWKKNKPYWKQLRKEMFVLMAENREKYNRETMPQCYQAAYPRLTRARQFASNVANVWRNGGLKGTVDRICHRLGGKD